MDNPYMPKPGEIIEIRPETKTEKTFVILLEGTEVDCGQFFEISLPGVGEAPFSVSYIGDDFIECTIRKIGRVSEAIHNLSVKDKIFLRGPYGHGFPVEEFSRRELAVIAGGTGVAPVRAVIRKVEEGGLKVKELKILLGFRDSESVLFKDDIRRWQDNFGCFVSLDYPSKDWRAMHHHGAWRGLSGFVNQHVDKLRLGNDARAAVVGPPAMIKFVADELIEEGVKAKDIWVSYERFMQCGMGKCGRCRIESRYVCLDGPVFDYATCKELRD